MSANSDESKMTRSSVAALDGSTTHAANALLSPASRAKTKSKSCGNSPKCRSREDSRAHSPLADWKKRSKNASPVAEIEREGGEEAPFIRDSAAGSAYSSPYSERATPPCMRWARSLEDVLDDYEGMELFKQYLAEQRESHLLDFWYACKGFKQLDPNERDRIKKVAERLYADYVASRSVYFLPCLTSEIRSAIRSRLLASGVDVDQTMYNDAQNEVQSYLRDRHAQFAGSDIYILYLQDIQAGGRDSPKCYSHEVHSNNSSSSGSEARRPSALLPTVHEDAEFEAETERLAVSVTLNSESAASDSAPKYFATAGTESADGDVLWSSHQAPPVPAKSCGFQQNVLASTSTGSQSGPAGVDEGAAASSGVKRRAASGGSGQQQTKPSGLTPHALAATFGQRLLATKPAPRIGGPPHPYHAPYVPYLPTSAQDSELQSMSSDATTESGFSGANYQRKEHHVMRHHVEHNRESRQILPRTNRPHAALSAQDMTNPEFCRRVKEELERLRRDQEHHEKLQESIKRLSEPENGHNDHRAAVNKFYSEERSRQTQNDDAEAILDDYCSRVPYFKDSPKQSPLRSPGFAGIGRRRSPIAKSPVRVMMAPYASAIPSSTASFTQTGSKTLVDTSTFMSQSAIQSNRIKSGHHSAGNTIHRASKHEQFWQLPAGATPSVDKRSGAIPKRPVPRYPPAASDTSGVYSGSGTSTEPSLVCARFTPTLAQKGVEQHWVVDGPPAEVVDSDTIRHKTRSGSTAPVASSVAEAKPHRYSSCRSEKSSNSEKGRSQKLVTDNVSGQTQKNPPAHSRRSEPAGLPSAAPYASGSGPVQELTVGIFLPSEETPYLVRFPGRQITLKQFKQLVPRKGSFRYFFQCVSDELGTATVRREVVDDHEILPLCDNKVVANIVANDE